MSDTFLIL